MLIDTALIAAAYKEDGLARRKVATIAHELGHAPTSFIDGAERRTTTWVRWSARQGMNRMAR